MNPQLNKTIEQLERDFYPVVTDSTGLVFRVTSLRKKPLAEFSIEDLRICIGQNHGLPYLIPLAIEQLSKNILAEGNCYEGDLLMVVLRANHAFWRANTSLWEKVSILCEANTHQLISGGCWKEFQTNYEAFKLIKG